MARLADVVVDCRHAASLARFWAAALDGYDVAPYDDAEIARLRSLGYAGPEEDPGILVERPDGAPPRLFFQQVADERSVLAEHDGRRVLADPEGNVFCVEERP